LAVLQEMPNFAAEMLIAGCRQHVIEDN